VRNVENLCPWALPLDRGLTRRALLASLQRGTTFELRLEVNKLSTGPAGLKPLLAEARRADVTTTFTESLILAQDERWRRA
jgi:hypothetical protein